MSQGEIVVKVDHRACIGCGSCVADCFPGAMVMNSAGKAECARPCLECGHCVAVCPVGAVSMGPDGDVEAYDPSTFDIEPERALRALKFRRSIRQFKNRALGQDVIRDLAEAVRFAPTAANRQRTRLVVVQGGMGEFRTLLWSELPGVVTVLEAEQPAYARTFQAFLAAREQTGRDPLLFNAPAFLVVSTQNMWDAGLAAASIESVACAHKAGVLHSGYLKRIVTASQQLQEWLGLDERGVGCCLLAGYPSVGYCRTVPRKPADCVLK